MPRNAPPGSPSRAAILHEQLPPGALPGRKSEPSGTTRSGQSASRAAAAPPAHPAPMSTYLHERESRRRFGTDSGDRMTFTLLPNGNPRPPIPVTPSPRKRQPPRGAKPNPGVHEERIRAATVLSDARPQIVISLDARRWSPTPIRHIVHHAAFAPAAIGPQAAAVGGERERRMLSMTFGILARGCGVLLQSRLVEGVTRDRIGRLDRAAHGRTRRARPCEQQGTRHRAASAQTH